MRIRPVLFALALVAAVLALAPASAFAQSTSSLDLKALGVSFLPAPTQTPAAPRAAQPQQQAHHEGIGIGFKLGPVFNRVDDSAGESEVESSKQTGMMYSLFLGGNRPGVVGVATELSLIKRKIRVGGGDETGDINTTFFEVPILLRINAGSHTLSGVCAYFMVGPSFDVRLKADTTFSDIKDGFKDETQAVNVGIIVAGGVEITRFIIEGRFTKDMRSIFKADNAVLEENRTLKQKSFILLFGIRFN
jgi:opacity protein-like surface antigen